MIYLKDSGGTIRLLRDSETKDAERLIGTGQWVRINGRKDFSEYVVKKTKPKKQTKANKKNEEKE